MLALLFCIHVTRPRSHKFKSRVWFVIGDAMRLVSLLVDHDYPGISVKTPAKYHTSTMPIASHACNKCLARYLLKEKPPKWTIRGPEQVPNGTPKDGPCSVQVMQVVYEDRPDTASRSKTQLPCDAGELLFGSEIEGCSWVSQVPETEMERQSAVLIGRCRPGERTVFEGC